MWDLHEKIMILNSLRRKLNPYVAKEHVETFKRVLEKCVIMLTAAKLAGSIEPHRLLTYEKTITHAEDEYTQYICELHRRSSNTK